MITFRPTRVNMEDRRTPVMYDHEIDALAHDVLADYMPELLRSPGKINAELFLEQYLGAVVEFYDIYNDDPDRPVLALTAFNDGVVRIFDREEEKVSRITVPARTVIIDNSVMEQGKEGLALFSGLHEAGHLILHWGVFNNEYDFADDETDSIVFCRRENIEGFRKAHKERTAEDWREHQADYFAAAIAMPNATFRPFVTRFLRENNIYKGQITLGVDSDLDILADDLLPEYISETYGVSKRAARIKLRKGQYVFGNAIKSKLNY